MPKTHVPMSPSELPQQRLYAIETLPPLSERPPVKMYGYDGHHSPKAMHRESQLIAQAEWAWSPVHNRIDAYWLHPGRGRWYFWYACFDDNDTPWRWVNLLAASCPRQGIVAQLAAVSLLAAFWKMSAQDHELEGYHWLNQTELLTVGQIEAIRCEVWPEENNCR